jgi:hypothetical protein
MPVTALPVAKPLPLTAVQKSAFTALQWISFVELMMLDFTPPVTHPTSPTLQILNSEMIGAEHEFEFSFHVPLMHE